MLHAPWNNRIRNFSGFFKDAWGLFAARCLLFSTTRPEQFSKQSGRAEKKRDASLSVCMFILDTLCDCKRDIDVYDEYFYTKTNFSVQLQSVSTRVRLSN